jgi:hypothetical protein
MVRSTISIIFLILAVMSMAYSMHVGSSAHAWKGYSPDCESQCEDVGEVCDIGKEKICCTSGLCEKKYGLATCSAPLLTFVCREVELDEQIATVINPKVYPNLYNPV